MRRSNLHPPWLSPARQVTSPLVLRGAIADDHDEATQLSGARWAYAFALVTSLFFTWGFAYGVRLLDFRYTVPIADVYRFHSSLMSLIRISSRCSASRSCKVRCCSLPTS